MTLDAMATLTEVPADHQGIFEPARAPYDDGNAAAYVQMGSMVSGTLDEPEAAPEPAKGDPNLDNPVPVEGYAEVEENGYYNWQNREIRAEALKYALAVVAQPTTTAILLQNAKEIEGYLRNGDKVPENQVG